MVRKVLGEIYINSEIENQATSLDNEMEVMKHHIEMKEIDKMK